MQREPLILAVDDEVAILRLLALELAAQDMRVITASTADEARTAAATSEPDAILLDLVMPGVDGFELLDDLRGIARAPIIVLTAHDSTTDKVAGLERGADDYVVKPFSADELGERIRRVLRGARGKLTEQVVRSDGVEIDPLRALVYRGSDLISLSGTEWQLLRYFASNAGKVLSSSEVLTSVWGPDYATDLQYLQAWVSRLRNKIERDPENPRIIRSVAGEGYRFEEERAATGPD